MTRGSKTLVPITPDGTIQWRSQEPPELHGSLLLADGATEEVADILTRFARNTEPLTSQMSTDQCPNYEQIYVGSQGYVYRIGNYALKAFYSQKDNLLSTERTDNLANLRVNVVLETGVKRISGENIGTKYFQNGMHYTTPQHLGAFIPYADSDPAIRPYWVMSYEPASASPHALPLAIRRRHADNREALRLFLHEAFRACGAKSSSAELSETISTSRPIIRYAAPKQHKILQWLLRSNPYETIECTVVLHDIRARI